MSWEDDPDVRAAELERSARIALIKGVILWMPFFIASLAGLLFFGFDRIFLDGENGSTWFLVVVLSIFTFLFGFQAMQPTLDLGQKPQEVTGVVIRRWAKSDSLVLRSHYVRLDSRHIFRIDKAEHGEVKEGDTVKVRFYPRSASVIRLDRVAVAADKKQDEGGDPNQLPTRKLR